MANVNRITVIGRREETTMFTSHSGTVYILRKRSADGIHNTLDIYAGTPTEANFNAAPVGSMLYDSDDYTSVKIKTGATTWGDFTIT